MCDDNRADVDQAVSMFSQLQQVDPYRLDNMDTYSNLLYVKVYYRQRKCAENYNIILLLLLHSLPSVPLRCWLGGRKGTRPVKKLEWWGPGMVICLERGATATHCLLLQ